MDRGPRLKRSLGMVHPAGGRVEAEADTAQRQAHAQLDVLGSKKGRVEPPYLQDPFALDRCIGGAQSPRFIARYCASTMACSQATHGCA